MVTTLIVAISAVFRCANGVTGQLGFSPTAEIVDAVNYGGGNYDRTTGPWSSRRNLECGQLRSEQAPSVQVIHCPTAEVANADKCGGRNYDRTAGF